MTRWCAVVAVVMVWAAASCAPRPYCVAYCEDRIRDQLESSFGSDWENACEHPEIYDAWNCQQCQQAIRDVHGIDVTSDTCFVAGPI